MRKPHEARLIIGIALSCVGVTAAAADDAMTQAKDTAEVFVYGREAKNEALLREISDPDQYESMAGKRAGADRKLNENIRVEDVEVTQIDGDRAIAKARYRQKNTKGVKSADVHLKRVDGKWQVTTAPDAAAAAGAAD